MIKFFRKIRQSLLSENKFSKYIIYAIGEIILVVIGILIALQINNWNDSRNKEQKTTTLLLDVLNEIEKNIEISTEKLPYFHEKDSVFNAIMFKQVTKETYLSPEFPEFKYMLNDSRKVELLEEAFNVLMANMQDVPLRYKTIIKDLSHLNKILKKEVDEWNKTFSNEFQDYVKYESENYSWFSDYSENGNGPILEYYLTSNDYKNRVAYRHDIVIHNLEDHVLKYRKAAITIYMQIAKLLELEMDSKNMVWQISNPKFYTGTYKLEFYIKNGFIWGNKKPTEQVTIIEKEKRLFMTSPLDTTKFEVIPFSKTQFFTVNKGSYFTYKINHGDTLIESNNGTIYKKITSNND
ncbi:DUF6090 family protein [uncultured Winogradskyella sp.]|uniref:DUF6090 family protein n=1 Tax=uncultured Winogradskyella sp. TaxID=395353 RepID=UPI0026065610|nr:DUF6090 family protein [uncultured Winogradskyella sp.]